MRSLFTFCISAASFIFLQSAQQVSRPCSGGQRSQCLAPKEREDSEVPRSSLLQVNHDGHHSVSSDRKTVHKHAALGQGPAVRYDREIKLPLTRNSTATVVSMASIHTFIAERAGVTFWVAIITTVFISIIVTLIGYFLVCEDRDTKLWQRTGELRTAPHSRGISFPRPSELMTEKEDARREIARQRAAENAAIDPQRYSSQSLQVTSGMKSPRQGSRSREGSRSRVPSGVGCQSARETSPFLQRSASQGGSIASPIAQPAVDTAMNGDGNFATRSWLCPGLVVPLGNECILAIRAVLTPFATATPSIIDILDLQGKAVLKANISGHPLRQANSLPPSAEPPAVALRTAGPAEHGRHGEGEVLGVCRQGEVSHGRPSMYIYNVRDELFGTLTRDSKGSGRWVFIDVRGSAILFFDGNYFDRSIIITDECNEQVADTEPWIGDFDVRGHYYKLRVVSETDVGLILCGLLSIEWLETSVMQP